MRPVQEVVAKRDTDVTELLSGAVRIYAKVDVILTILGAKEAA
jgi:hypothetical protein